MKIYDCFIFFNENLLTEIRLNLLDDYVDYFVICESQYDHRGNFKGYLFNQKKFTKFEKKIIYLKIDSFPQNIGAWERQDFQRDYLENGLLNADKDDLIIYSDADEIINPRIISKMNNLESNVGICDQLITYANITF
jgi:beta-1,4-mannosyl-glycoprotein beta-1,4-N-acetylglucosaminyltransferase